MANEEAVVDDVARTERLLAAYGERAASDRRAARIGVGAEQYESERALLDECAGACARASPRSGNSPDGQRARCRQPTSRSSPRCGRRKARSRASTGCGWRGPSPPCPCRFRPGPGSSGPSPERRRRSARAGSKRPAPRPRYPRRLAPRMRAVHADRRASEDASDREAAAARGRRHAQGCFRSSDSSSWSSQGCP
jgi:hypothetical protein